MTKIKLYPMKIEAYDDDTKDKLFVVEADDEFAATVAILTVVNVASWDEFSVEIRKALVMLNLEGDEVGNG